MANRIRNERLEIKLTKEEKALFEEKRKLAKCRNMSHFLRKCVLEKEIYQVDLQPFADLQELLYNATNNINQIAKRVNSTGIIYSDDINDMKKQMDHISKEIWQIHSLLLGRDLIQSFLPGEATPEWLTKLVWNFATEYLKMSMNLSSLPTLTKVIFTIISSLIM